MHYSISYYLDMYYEFSWSYCFFTTRLSLNRPSLQKNAKETTAPGPTKTKPARNITTSEIIPDLTNGATEKIPHKSAELAIQIQSYCKKSIAADFRSVTADGLGR